MKDSASSEGIASVVIVGMAGRFPGAPDLDTFWHNLREGVESISFFSPEELRESGVATELIRHPNYVNAKGVLPDADLFDATFFGINHREAEVIDPQQRVFLECAWEALESAGYDPGMFDGSIGVYAGGGMSTYFLSNLMGNQGLIDAVGAYQVMLGSEKDFLTTRVSYKLNLKGPSVVIQTACSTSLVAVQNAYQALLNYQCDMALAGGVSIGFPQKAGYMYQEGMILSPDGHCRAFDAKAKGTVGGEGAGIVVLKRLEDALAAGDRILAIIKGAAINNDGSAKIGYTAPSVEGQAEVIAMAQSLADVKADTISYVEAHGTGTALGDPIEVAALTRAFRMGTNKNGFCALGSVKTNIGHLDAAAGVAGLIKTVLSLHHRQIPPSLHFRDPNPEIDFTKTPFYVNAALTDWKEGPTPRRAGVSSFGMGGTNAHVILEEAPSRPSTPSHRSHHVVPLSARTSLALESATDNLVEHLQRDTDPDLADAAFTLQVGRHQFSLRRVVVCGEKKEASRYLETRDGKRVFTGAIETGNRPVAFLLTGQGAQHIDMARGIYEHEPVFRRHLDHCAEKFHTLMGLDLRSLLYPESRNAQEAAEDLRRTGNAQPALFAVEYALARLWMDWGVRPQALLGHSLGEYVAACLAGVFSLDDALKLVAERGRLMQSLPGGSMLAVPLDEAALRAWIGDDLSLAAVNAPRLCVVSGACEAIDALQGRLTREGIQARPLHTSHAFHSPMMDPIVDSFVAKVSALPLRPPTIPILSNLTGTWLAPEEATDPAYWGRHLRQTVNFSDGVAKLLSDPKFVLLEVGPGQTLISLARQQAHPPDKHVMFSTLAHPQEKVPDDLSMLNTLGRLWLAGVDVDWKALHADDRRRRVQLPTYPFQRERYFVEPVRSAREDGQCRGEVKKIQDLSRWFYVPSWRRTAPSGLASVTGECRGKQTWLACLDRHGVGHKLVERLRSAGHDVITVLAGERYAHGSDDGYLVDPASREDYDALFKDLARRNRIPSHLLHLFSLTEGNTEPSVDTFMEKKNHRGFYSLLFSVQAFTSVFPATALKVEVISNHTQDVSGNETIDADKALLFGPSRVMPQEFKNLHCRNIDVDAHFGVPGSDDELISRIYAEIMADVPNAVVALRNGQRWVQHFEPLNLPPAPVRERFRDGGVYLIIGGTSTLGLSIAKCIARNVRARLVLTSLEEPIPRATQISNEDARKIGVNLAHRIETVREIEDSGSEVLTVVADIADEEAMRGVMHTIDESYGALHGVIHAEGFYGLGSFLGMMELDHTQCERLFRPKVTGVRILERLLRGRKLDFCHLASSLSSVLGGIGYTTYSASNWFIDAFAHERNRGSDFPWITINWDACLSAQEAGQAVGLQLSMTPEEGAEVFARVLAANSLKQVIVSTGDLQRRADRWIRQTTDEQIVNPNEGTIVPTHARPDLSSDFLPPDTDVEKAVAKIWQELLGVEGIGGKDNFFELGGHSLLATQLVSRLRETFDVEIPLRGLFGAPTVAEMAVLIEETLFAEIEALSEEEAERRTQSAESGPGGEDD